MRTDGDHNIYILQIQNHSTGKYVDTSPPSDYTNPVWAPFSASGDCWQETGIHGCYKEEEGLAALALMAQTDRGKKFRLVCRHMTQTTTEVAAMALAPESKPKLRR